jgi:hypothetical protein
MENYYKPPKMKSNSSWHKKVERKIIIGHISGLLNNIACGGDYIENIVNSNMNNQHYLMFAKKRHYLILVE